MSPICSCVSGEAGTLNPERRAQGGPLTQEFSRPPWTPQDSWGAGPPTP